MTVLQPLTPRVPDSSPSHDWREREAGHPVLLVRARSRLCALPVEHVLETMRPLSVEQLSGPPPFVRGMTVIRGEAVPVVDLGMLLEGAGEGEVGRFVTLRIGGRRVALAVGSVVRVRDLDPRKLRELPPLLRDVEGDRVAAVATLDDQLLVLLQAARLVPEETWEALAARPLQEHALAARRPRKHVPVDDPQTSARAGGESP